jgi:ABC-2 type transport system ATP-binding protein
MSHGGLTGSGVEMRKVIREIGKDRTVLLSTHILTEAQQICDRVLIINKGRIVTEDTPENLQARLAGSQRVLLRVRGEADELPAKISKIKGIRDVEAKPDGSVEFEFSAGQDVRPLVAKTVVQAGFDLLEMRPIGLSLEEIFLELTRDNASDKKAS